MIVYLARMALTLAHNSIQLSFAFPLRYRVDWQTQDVLYYSVCPFLWERTAFIIIPRRMFPTLSLIHLVLLFLHAHCPPSSEDGTVLGSNRIGPTLIYWYYSSSRMGHILVATSIFGFHTIHRPLVQLPCCYSHPKIISWIILCHRDQTPVCWFGIIIEWLLLRTTRTIIVAIFLD